MVYVSHLHIGHVCSFVGIASVCMVYVSQLHIGCMCSIVGLLTGVLVDYIGLAYIAHFCIDIRLGCVVAWAVLSCLSWRTPITRFLCHGAKRMLPQRNALEAPSIVEVGGFSSGGNNSLLQMKQQRQWHGSGQVLNLIRIVSCCALQ